MSGCDDCLRRAWLIGALADHLARAHERVGALDSVLALTDAELIEALAGTRAEPLRRAHASFAPAAARERAASVGLEVVCPHGHDGGYPAALAALPDAPAALHVAGGQARLATLAAGPAAAIVGARRASPYGLEVARALGRSLSAAGVTVVSGMALGADSAAHAGALEAAGRTMAVLGGGADVAYPASKRALHRQIAAAGCVISEAPPGMRPRRWCFPARNRIIAGLAAVTIVVEAAERSGSLITARIAREIGRDVAAVPGRITSPRARGSNDLLADGAHIVRGPEDVLDLLFGAGGWEAAAPGVGAPPGDTPLDPALGRLLGAIADGRDTLGALATDPVDAGRVLAGLSELELLGRVRRVGGGRYVPVV